MRWLRWLRGIDLPPWGRALPPIAVLHFECARCGSLVGGIAGKGPWTRLRTAQAPACRHVWRACSEQSFRELAKARFGAR